MDLVYGVCLKYFKESERSKDAVMQIFEELIVKLKKHEVENFIGGGRVESIPPPPGAVFAVHVTPNTSHTEYPEIRGWINHWAWVDEDPALPEAPIDWVSRYQERLWTR
jgi:hypothetical protein